jgi:hypothetical protein
VPAAERQPPQGGTLAGSDGQRRGLAVGEQGQDRRGRAPADQLGQQARGVGGSAAARVVLGVGEDRGPPLPGAGDRARHRVPGRPESAGEAGLGGREGGG